MPVRKLLECDPISKYGKRVWWTCDTPIDVQWAAGHEESPSFLLLTFLRQCLEIPQLAQRCAP